MILDERPESAVLKRLLPAWLRSIADDEPMPLGPMLAEMQAALDAEGAKSASLEDGRGPVLMLMREIAAASPEDGFLLLASRDGVLAAGSGRRDAALLGLASGLLKAFCRDAYAVLPAPGGDPNGLILGGRMLHEELGGLHDSSERFGWKLARFLAPAGPRTGDGDASATRRLFRTAASLLDSAASLAGRLPDGRITEYNRLSAKAAELMDGRRRPAAA